MKGVITLPKTFTEKARQAVISDQSLRLDLGYRDNLASLYV